MAKNKTTKDFFKIMTSAVSCLIGIKNQIFDCCKQNCKSKIREMGFVEKEELEAVKSTKKKTVTKKKVVSKKSATSKTKAKSAVKKKK